MEMSLGSNVDFTVRSPSIVPKSDTPTSVSLDCKLTNVNPVPKLRNTNLEFKIKDTDEGTNPNSKVSLHFVFSPRMHMTAPACPLKHEPSPRTLDPDISLPHSVVLSKLCSPSPTTLTPTKFKSSPQTYFVLSLLVAVFFNLPLGMLAMCLSLRAGRAYTDGRLHNGDCWANSALATSLVGILITEICFIMVIVLVLEKK